MKKLMVIIVAGMLFTACNSSTDTTTTVDSTATTPDNTNTNQDRTDTAVLNRDTLPSVTDSGKR